MNKSIERAINSSGSLTVWEDRDIGRLKTGQGKLFISRGKFNYAFVDSIVNPAYIELEGVNDFTLLYVNGMLIGKYFPEGRQKRFYLWKSWLRDGWNEICLVGWFKESENCKVFTGVYHTKIKGCIDICEEALL